MRLGFSRRARAYWIDLFPKGGWARVLAAAASAVAAGVLLGEQGARIGPFILPSLDSRWLYLVAGIGIFLAPKLSSANGRGRFLRVVWIPVALGWPLTEWRARVLDPSPLTASIYRPSESRGRPEGVVRLDWRRLERRIPLQQIAGRQRDVAFQVSGFLLAPSNGRYRFEFMSDGLCALSIGGTKVLDDAQRGSGTVELDRGAHPFALRYAPQARPAFLRLSWDRPALWEALPLPHYIASRAEALSPSAGRNATLAWGASVLFWAFLCALAARAGECRDAWLPSLGRLFRKEGGERLGKPFYAVLASAILLLLSLKALRPFEEDSQYARLASSEYMMQTVSVADLRDDPLKSLWFLHIQPPLFDGLRAVVAQLYPRLEPELLIERVDAQLYAIWSAAYALLGGLAYLWLRRLTSRGFALAASLLFLLHPGAIFYATYLDSTLVSALGVTWFFYELWKIARRQRGSVFRLAAAALFLFFTRSAFQWPFLCCVALALFLVGCSRKEVLRFTLVVGAGMGLYIAKQYWVFGVTTTSTFAGYNGCRSIGADLSWDRGVPLPRPLERSMAAVLSREKKPNGEFNFNQITYLQISFALWERYKKTLRSQPLSVSLAAYGENLRIYLEPTSRYLAHPIVDALPWRAFYDRVFSNGWVVSLVVLALATYLGLGSAEDRRLTLGLLLPAGYIVLVSVCFESGENMRFRFFVEPALYVFLASQLHRAVARVRRRPS